MLASRERGDTLVEVMVAIAVMAAVTVGVLAILNRGIGEAQNSSERTAVRAVVSEQVELLNYFRDEYVAAVASGGLTNTYPASVWATIKNKAASGNAFRDAVTCTPANEAFYLEHDAATDQYELKDFTGNAVSSASPSINNGLWVDARDFQTSVTDPLPYIDFIVKACWMPISGSVEQNLSSAVRLYDR